MTTTAPTGNCPTCGYQRPVEPCAVCGGKGVELGRRGPLRVGRRNPVADVLRGVDDVRRATISLLYSREFVGILRMPVFANLLAIGVLAAVALLWLLPAFESSLATERDGQRTGSHLWLLAVWFAAGPAMIDFLTGWALGPIRRATELQMLGATPTHPVRNGPRLIDRLQLMMVAAIAIPLAMALATVPYVGLPLVLLLGAATAAITWLQTPGAVRGLPLPARLQLIRRNPWRAFGTGLGLQLAALVPFVNVLAWSLLATIASTSAWLHFEKVPPADAPAR